MIVESLDKTISMAIAVSSAALGLWAHRREMVKEKKRVEIKAHKDYAQRELKEYAAQRDFGHIQRDIEQLKVNISHLNDESDQRLDKLERQVEKMLGAVDTIKDMIRSQKA